MAKSILVSSHVETAEAHGINTAPGLVFCVHTTRPLTQDELEKVRLALVAAVDLALQVIAK